MIKTEQLTINNKQFTKTVSDNGFYIERDGVQYSEAGLIPKPIFRLSQSLKNFRQNE